MNSYGYECLRKLGFEKIILSTEMNEMTVRRLTEAYKARTGKDANPYTLRHGRRPLMYLKRDPIAKYRKAGHEYDLDDGAFVLELKEYNGIYELIETKDGGREIPETGDFIIIRNAEDREAFL